jgi:hypothetical protein
MRRRLVVGFPQDQMRRRDHVLEARAFVGLQVERAVDQDVGLDPFKMRKRPSYFVFSRSISVHCFAACSIDIPRAIGRPYEWSVIPRHVCPNSVAASAMVPMRSAPSLHVECIWKSPR